MDSFRAKKRKKFLKAMKRQRNPHMFLRQTKLPLEKFANDCTLSELDVSPQNIKMILVSNKPAEIPYKSVCDAIFRAELLPAVYRWVSALSKEELARFNTVFPRLAREDSPDEEPMTASLRKYNLVPSKYTLPEWNSFEKSNDVEKDPLSVESLLKTPTTSHLSYGAFDQEQMRQARAIPTRTRENDKSQINATERSKEYMERWGSRMMNTTYRQELCHSTYRRTVKNETPTEKILVYSKRTLNDKAIERAMKWADKDPVWTRAFRELCKGLADAIDSTAYRSEFTTLKKAEASRFLHPKWRDPVPVTRGMKKSAESYWESTQRGSFIPSQRPDETFKAADLHRANYQRPFDIVPIEDKWTTSMRDDYLDHIKNKDDQPAYWVDMVVRMPPGSAVVGDVLGAGPRP